MRARKYENGARITTRQMRPYDKRVSPTREAMLRLEREASDASIKRAMREMGFDIGPDDELANPPESLLREKGMNIEEWFDEVYKRAREHAITPVWPREAPRVELDEPSIQRPGDGEGTMAREARGGMGASATEDLLERLNQFKRNAYGNKYDQGGRFPSNRLGERMYGQETSEIRSDDKGSFVWYAGDTDGLPSGSSDQEWKDRGAVRVYGDFSKYSNSRSRFLHDEHDYIIRPTEDGSYELDEEQTQAQAGMEKGFGMAEEVQYNDRGTAKDLLGRLNRVNPSGNKYEQGGMVVKKKGSTIKIAGQHAVDSIKTTPEGNQYVSMELPDGKVVPVFGDWETYGNPNQQGLIEDLDFRIYPLGDGTYALDASEAEAEMLRDEARGVSRDADDTEDLLQELNQRSSMRGMRPVKTQ
tara:strand:- start:1323 stop:2567 length:1245 start_codon:yes stop_codon:yes gene_type:complete